MDRISEIPPLEESIEDLFLPKVSPEPPPVEPPITQQHHTPSVTATDSTAKSNAPEKKSNPPPQTAPEQNIEIPVDELLGKDEGGPNVDDLEALLAASSFDIEDLLK